MKKSSMIYFSITGVLLALFIAFTLIVKFVDVNSLGPLSSNIGLSHININIFKQIGTKEIFDKITDILLVFSAMIAFTIACIGIIQAVIRKSILKVDKYILFMAGLYVLIALCYIIFELIVINFRPVIIDSIHEVSYPSTHTLIVCTVLISSIFVFNSILKNKILQYCYIAGTSILTALTIVFRLMSGMHWFTDIVAAVILSAFLVMLYVSVLSLFNKKKNTSN